MMLIIFIDEKKGLFSKDFMQVYHPINLAAFIIYIAWFWMMRMHFGACCVLFQKKVAGTENESSIAKECLAWIFKKMPKEYC